MEKNGTKSESNKTQEETSDAQRNCSPSTDQRSIGDLLLPANLPSLVYILGLMFCSINRVNKAHQEIKRGGNESSYEYALIKWFSHVRQYKFCTILECYQGAWSHQWFELPGRSSEAGCHSWAQKMMSISLMQKTERYWQDQTAPRKHQWFRSVKGLCSLD